MRNIVLAVVVAVVSIWSSEAMAARGYSYNEVIFDANDKVIGQHMEYCNDVRWEGGAQEGAYKLLVYGACSNKVQICEPAAGGTTYCYLAAGGYQIEATLVGSTVGVTVEDACNLTEVCDFWEPDFVRHVDFSMHEI